jgi:hypothetical protein
MRADLSQSGDTFGASPPSRKGREFEGGSRLARYLLMVRSEEPRRVDVLPVTLWDPPEALIDADPAPGHPIWVAGSVQRRFWAGAEGRKSRLEVVAEQICLREVPEGV